MSKVKSKSAYEAYLNDVGSTFEECAYMDNQNRLHPITSDLIKYMLMCGRFGSLLRKHDARGFKRRI